MQSIQIIKYRETLNTDTGKRKFIQTLVGEAPSIPDLFANIDKYIEQIPEAERRDIHYTLAQCYAESMAEGIPLRAFFKQEVLAFDIDKCDPLQEPRYTKIISSVLRVKANEIAISCSGNGLHYLIYLDPKFHVTDTKTLEDNKKYYQAICGEINQEIYLSGLIGECDPVTYAVSKTLRLPNTINPKPPEKMSYIISSNMVAQSLDITKVVSIVEVKDDKEILHRIEPQAILKGCKFLNHCRSYPNKVTEPEWFKMISILSLIQPIGETLCHEYSKGHDGYSQPETQRKYEQARHFGKPSTCDSVNQIWGSCHECPYYNKVKTPLAIKSDEYIATEKDGFHKVIKKDGIPIKYVPNFQDLVKYYEKQNRYVVNRESRVLSHYNGTHWEEVNKLEIEAFATKNFNPPATNTMRSEFYGLLTTRNLKDDDFFSTNLRGYINFKNGVLDINSKTLMPHSPDFGFRYCLPYDYNPNAKCPTFDKFLNDVTMGDTELAQALLQFLAYTISGTPASYGQKALILLGEGSNGKSVLMNLIKAMVGEDCYSSVSVGTLNNAISRYQLVGKLFNISEEAPTNALTDSSDFKAIVSGGTTEIKKLYHQPTHARIDCKLIFSCNNLPYNYDYTEGTFRRLLIIPFRNSFTTEKGNKVTGFEDYLYPEMSGIYNRLLESYIDFIRLKGIPNPRATNEILEEYRLEDNVYEYFIEKINYTRTVGQGIPIRDPSFLSNREIMKDYASWCLLKNTRQEPDVRFFRKMTSYIIKKYGDLKGSKRIEGKLCRGYDHLELKGSDTTADF